MIICYKSCTKVLWMWLTNYNGTQHKTHKFYPFYGKSNYYPSTLLWLTWHNDDTTLFILCLSLSSWISFSSVQSTPVPVPSYHQHLISPHPVPYPKLKRPVVPRSSSRDTNNIKLTILNSFWTRRNMKSMKGSFRFGSVPYFTIPTELFIGWLIWH